MKQAQSKLPKFGDWLLKLLARYDVNPHLRGDFDEEFSLIYETKGFVRAWFWYWTHLLRSLPFFIKDILYWRFIMIKNYLKIALRHMKRHKGFSWINIAGLAIGIACFLLFMLYVRFELSYDSMHVKKDDIFRLRVQVSDENGITYGDTVASPHPVGPALMEQIPEIECATRICPFDEVFLVNKNLNFREKVLFADEHFFNVFSFKLLFGDKNRVLKNLNSIVISRTLAEKMFGNQDPIGKTISGNDSYSGKDLGELMVTGIVEDVPVNSHIQFDCLIPFEKKYPPGKMSDWLNCFSYNYLLLSEGVSIQKVEKKINSQLEGFYSRTGFNSQWKFLLQSLKYIHLRSHFSQELSTNGDIKYVRLFSAIAIFVLLLACINYMNLATAQASKRAKEIGIRKVVGAKRNQLLHQFMGESLFLSAFATILAFGLVCLLLPWFRRFIEKQIDIGVVFDIPTIIGVFMIVGILGLLSGLFPALFLSSFHPIKVLSVRTVEKRKGFNLRNILVLFQFSITLILFISSVVIFRQIRYIKNKDLGFIRDQVVCIWKTDPGIKKNYNAFVDAVQQNPGVLGMTSSSHLPINISSSGTRRTYEEDGDGIKEFSTNWILVDPDYINVFEIDILEGRNFSEEFGTDKENAVLVNEAFVKMAGWTQPLGKQVLGWGGGVVVGVVKDFHFHTLQSVIKPLFFAYMPDEEMVRRIAIRISPESLPKTLAHIKKSYERYNTIYPFDFTFLDEQFVQMYRSEQKTGQMLLYFSALAVFIACLGIYGLASFTAERRTKEIGIRKVLGASSPRILILLSMDFTKWILSANIIAWPLAYVFMKKWLSNFSYNVGLEIWVFGLAALIALFLALMTAGTRSLKAALANPVNSLKYE